MNIVSPLVRVDTFPPIPFSPASIASNLISPPTGSPTPTPQPISNVESIEQMFTKVRELILNHLEVKLVPTGAPPLLHTETPATLEEVTEYYKSYLLRLYSTFRKSNSSMNSTLSPKLIVSPSTNTTGKKRIKKKKSEEAAPQQPVVKKTKSAEKMTIVTATVPNAQPVVRSVSMPSIPPVKVSKPPAPPKPPVANAINQTMTRSAPVPIFTFKVAPQNGPTLVMSEVTPPPNFIFVPQSPPPAKPATVPSSPVPFIPGSPLIPPKPTLVPIQPVVNPVVAPQSLSGSLILGTDMDEEEVLEEGHV